MNFLQFLKLDEEEIKYHTLSKIPDIEKKVKKSKTIIKSKDNQNKLNEVTNELSNEVTNELSNELTNELSNELSSELSNELLNEVSNEVTNELEIDAFSDLFKRNKFNNNKIFRTYENKNREYKVNIHEDNFKKDDRIRIVYVKDSKLNTYKGYNGEIKHYIKDASEAIIILEALPYPRTMSFPIIHFSKLN